jgi:site-specific DNA-cytosine methylase
MSYRAVDVMSFAGGFTLGMVQAGFELVGKRELKGGFGVPSCEANRHLLGNNWQTEIGDGQTWSVPAGGADVVFGNPPCSGWSVMSHKKFRGADSPALSCTWAFADYVIRAKPLIAVFESVQQAFTHKDGLTTMRALRDHVEAGTGEKWELFHIRHNAYSVGGCAQRRRYFWLISRVPFGIEMPKSRILPKLNDVLNDLVNLGRTWYPQPYRAPAHPWVEQLRSSNGTVDGHINLDNPLTRRIGDLLTGTDWKPGEAIATVTRRYYEQHGKLPASFATTEQKLVAKDFVMGFTTPTRWNGGNAARVITGGGMQMVIHPWLDRMITHRECARILGFPDDWKIQPLRKVSGLHMTWGKGISTHCGKWIGSWIKRALDDNAGSYVGNPLGEREHDIDCTDSWKVVDPRLNIKRTIMVQ